MSDLPPPPPPNMSPPPGYVAYGGAGAVTGRFRKTRGLSKWLVGLLIASAVMQVALLVTQLAIRSDAEDFLDRVISKNDFTDRLGAFAAVGALTGLLTLAQLVVLIIWTFRMAGNLKVLGRTPQSFSPGATIAVNILGGCTLGILNFFMWSELWKGSDPETAPGDPTWKQRMVSPLIGLHLGLTIAGVAASIGVSVARGFGGGLSFGQDEDDIAEQLSDRFAFIGLSGLVAVATAIVFIMLVRQLSARHIAATREP